MYLYLSGNCPIKNRLNLTQIQSLILQLTRYRVVQNASTIKTRLENLKKIKILALLFSEKNKRDLLNIKFS